MTIETMKKHLRRVCTHYYYPIVLSLTSVSIVLLPSIVFEFDPLHCTAQTQLCYVA